jgi:hypothetical protein
MDVAPRIDPAYGPSLPELLRRRLPAGARRALAVLAVVAVVGGLAAWLLAPGEFRYVHRSDPVFNTRWRPDGRLKRVDPPPGAILRLEARRHGRVTQSFTVRPLRLPAGSQANTTLAAMGTAAERRLAATAPGFVRADEGKAVINDAPGYQVGFRVREGGRTVFGRQAWLVDPEGDGRTGLFVELRQDPGGPVKRVEDLGVNGPLRAPFRSLRFGTQGP